MSYQKEIKQSASLPVSNELKTRPAAGYSYIYQFEDAKQPKDWWAERWLWKQQKTQKYSRSDGSEVCMYYFDGRVGTCGVASRDFQKRVFTNSNYPTKSFYTT